jgi:choline kinase
MPDQHGYPVQHVEARTGNAIKALADAARAATGTEEASLKRRLDETMQDAHLPDYKPARVRARFSVFVTDLELVRAWSIKHGFVEVDAHADETRLRRDLGEWIKRRLHEGLEVPPDGFEIRSAVQL